MACVAFGQAVHAANGQSFASGVAKARVIAPLSVVELDDLDFGFVREVAGRVSSVSISPLSAMLEYRGGPRNACEPGAACPAAHPARFSVTGEAGRAYVITLPGSIHVATSGDLTMQHADGLLVTDLSIRTNSAPSSGNRGILDPSGHDTFAVGGTLRLQPGTGPGHYRAMVPVAVTYE